MAPDGLPLISLTRLTCGFADPLGKLEDRLAGIPPLRGFESLPLRHNSRSDMVPDTS
jgi:hypothetical protein